MTKKNRIFRNRTKRNKEGGMQRNPNEELMFPRRQPPSLRPKRSTPISNRVQPILESMLLQENNDDANRLNTMNELINAHQYYVNHIYSVQEENVKMMFVGNNLLHQAIINNYPTQAILLIEQNETNTEFLNAQTNEGLTPLMLTIKYHSINVFNKLLTIHQNRAAVIDVGPSKIINNRRTGSGSGLAEPGAKYFTTLLYNLFHISYNAEYEHYGQGYEFNYDENDMSTNIGSANPGLGMQLNMYKKLFRVFGNNLAPGYATPNGLTALLYITDVADFFDPLNAEFVEMVDMILETNQYNPQSVYLDENSYGRFNSTALMNLCTTKSYYLVSKLFEKRAQYPNELNFDINSMTEDEVNALYCLFTTTVLTYDDVPRIANLLLDNGIDINIIAAQMNDIGVMFPRGGASLLMHMCDSVMRDLHSVFSDRINDTGTPQESINSLGGVVEVFRRILERPIEENNVTYILHDSDSNLYANALTTYVNILNNVINTHILAGIETDDIISIQAIEEIPLMILNSTTFTLEYLNLTNARDETSFDIATRLGLVNLARRLEELTNEAEEREENNKPPINLYALGTRLLGEETSVYNHISRKNNNIVFQLNENIFLLDKKVIRTHADNNQNIVYRCLERDEFNLNNVDRSMPYSLLNKYSAVQGAITYQDVMELLNGQLTGQLFVLEQIGMMNSNVNKKWVDYQLGLVNASPTDFNGQTFCRAGPLAIYKLSATRPFIPETQQQMQEQPEQMEIEEINPNVLKVQARVTLRTPDNKLVEKGVKQIDTIRGQTTMNELKNMIIASSADDIPIENLEVRRIIFSGKDYSNEMEGSRLISDIITNEENNTFQPVIIAFKSGITGGRKPRMKLNRKKYSLKRYSS